MPKPVKPPPPITDVLLGSTGNDTLELAGGRVALNGAERAILTGSSSITLNGGDGNDLIRTDSPHTSGGAAAYYDGGRGIDTIDFSTSPEAVAVSLYQGTRPGSSQPWIMTNFALQSWAVEGPDYFDPNDPSKFIVRTDATIQTANLRNIENVVGSAFDDYLSLGSTGPARADGGAGNDYILGSGGSDVLLGGSGDDFLFGKAADDVLIGGAGADQFQVLTYNGLDVITDFNPAEDQLFIGWQTNISEIATAGNWYTTTWTDADGNVHTAIRCDFVGGGVVLVDLTLADVAAVSAATTIFDWFA